MHLMIGTIGVRMNDFLKDIIKTTGNEYASLVADGVEAGDVDNFIDTGSYVFNALLSGSINGGLPANKITALAGESATGKTFFLMGIVKNFLDANPKSGVIYFESESAITKQMVIDRGIDPDRMVIVPVTTVQEFRTQAIKVLDRYLQDDVNIRKPLFLFTSSESQPPLIGSNPPFGFNRRALLQLASAVRTPLQASFRRSAPPALNATKKNASRVN